MRGHHSLKFMITLRSPKEPLVEEVYHTGVSLTKKAMKELEERFDRLLGLEKWFVRIEPLPV